MQPARRGRLEPDRAASAASASACLGAGCRCPRAGRPRAERRSRRMYFVPRRRPGTIGSAGTAGPGRGRHDHRPASARRRQERTPRAVVRWLIRGPVRARRADPSRCLRADCPSRRLDRVPAREDRRVCQTGRPTRARRIDRRRSGLTAPARAAQPVRRAGRRGGAASQGSAARARSCSSRGPEGARLASQGAGDGRRPGGARLGRRARRAPTSSRRATRSRGALEREGADLVLFGQQSTTPTAPSSGPQSPTGCAARYLPGRRAGSPTARSAASARPSSATT